MVEKRVVLIFRRKNENLIIEDIISNDSAIKNGIPLDTSMNTSKCRRIFKIKFECL